MSDRLLVPRGMSRRHFLGHMATTTLAVPAIQFFGAMEANAQRLRKANKSCILLWMSGGPSHMDTWDLKPESEKNGGPFKPIATSAGGVEISEHLPNVAKQMQHLNIIRSLDSKEGNHDRGTYMMHTGYAPNPTVVHPELRLGLLVRAGREAGELRPAPLHRDQLAGPGGGLPRHGACAVRRAEPQRADRQSAAPQGGRPDAHGSPVADAEPGRERTSWRRSGARRRSTTSAVYAKTVRMMNSRYTRRLPARRRARQGPRRLRPGLVRVGLPDGPATGRAGRDVRRGLARRLGHAHRRLRDALAIASSPSSTRGWGAWSPTSPGAACSRTRWSSGWASSAGPRGSTRTPAAITGREAGRWSWAAAA